MHTILPKEALRILAPRKKLQDSKRVYGTLGFDLKTPTHTETDRQTDPYLPHPAVTPPTL